jgi:hypothetical protein
MNKLKQSLREIRQVSLSKTSENPAIENLMDESDTGSPVEELEKLRKKPANKAREALDQLFLQSQGKELLDRYTASSRIDDDEKPVVGGDPAAIRAYASLVREHVANLNFLLSTYRELVLPFSRNCFSWPMLISKRKVFGDDADELIRVSQVGEDTIANDPAARFDPTKKFGKVAWNLLGRIEYRRAMPPGFFESYAKPSWASAAQKLRAFSTKASSEEQKNWLEVMEQVLDEDFRDPRKADDYFSLLSKPSYTQRRRLKAAFFDKVRNEFATLWGSRRQPKK